MTSKKPTLTTRVAALEETIASVSAPKAAEQDPEDAARWRARQAQNEAVTSAIRTTQSVLLAVIREGAAGKASTLRIRNLAEAVKHLSDTNLY